MAERIIKGMKEVLDGIKGSKKKAGISRKLTPTMRHSRALNALTKAMLDSKRKWKHRGNGVYVLGKYTVETHSDFEKGFHVLVDNVLVDNEWFPIPLGSGCVAELDKFVKDTTAIMDAKKA